MRKSSCIIGRRIAWKYSSLSLKTFNHTWSLIQHSALFKAMVHLRSGLSWNRTDQSWTLVADTWLSKTKSPLKTPMRNSLCVFQSKLQAPIKSCLLNSIFCVSSQSTQSLSHHLHLTLEAYLARQLQDVKLLWKTIHFFRNSLASSDCPKKSK